MNNTILDKHKGDPGWAEVVRLYSGLFENQSEREEFILILSNSDMILATECKMTSINEEEKLENELITKAFYGFKLYDDYLSLLTLFMMGEYRILTDLLNFKYKSNIPEKWAFSAILKYINSISFINSIKSYLPIEEYTKMLQLILGSKKFKDISDYEAIIVNSDFNKSSELYEEMRNYYIYPNLKIMNFMIEKCQSDKIMYYYNEMKSYNIIPNKLTLQILIRRYNIHRNQNIIAEVFDKLEIKKFKKGSYLKTYISFISVMDKYENILLHNEKLKIEYANLFNENIPKNSMLGLIEILIEHSENYLTAKKWFSKAISEYGYDLPNRIFINFVLHFEDDTINEFINSYHEKLIPNIEIIESDDKIMRIFSLKLEKIFLKLIKLATTFSSFQILLSDIRSRYEQVPISVYIILLDKFNEKEQIVYLINEIMKDKQFSPKNIASAINNYGTEKSLIILSELKKNNLNKNIFYYNTIIKNCQCFNTSNYLLDEVKSNLLLADKYTFTPMIQQTKTINDLYYLLKECCFFKVPLDDILVTVIQKQIFGFKKIFILDFKNSSKSLYTELNNDYFNLLNNLYSNLIRR